MGMGEEETERVRSKKGWRGGGWYVIWHLIKTSSCNLGFNVGLIDHPVS